MKRCSCRPGISVLSMVVFIGLFAAGCSEKQIIFKSEAFEIGLNGHGEVVSFRDITSDLDYHFKDTLAPILSIWHQGNVFHPESASFDENTKTLSLTFAGGRNVEVKVEQKRSHITFELTAMAGADETDLVLWGPYHTTINGIIGETVGVVRDEDFAIGIQSLNPKTLGGYPWNENDEMPQMDIFEKGDCADMSRKDMRYVLYRVEAAKPTCAGSSLQAYTRNRNKERVIANWGMEKYTVPALNDGGLIGSKIALFGSRPAEVLATLGEIEVAEGLPHPTIDGQWGKQARSASAAYMIMGFSEQNIDRAIAYTQQAGLRYLYHDGPFENWGHFDLKKASFPNGWAGMREVVDKAEAKGLTVGVHTLSNFITTNDPYVSPVPDKRLAKVGSAELSANVGSTDKEIPVTSPDFFQQLQSNSLKTVQVGSELIRYGRVSAQAPWKLLDCQRGAYGTQATSHSTGSSISLLADHAYKVFLTSPELGKEMAENLAKFYNETGLRQISFDGVEGNQSTGLGNYGEILFTQQWYNELSDDIKSHLIIDASRTSHFFWHMYTRMNWGEPWYAGFRESQTEYRLKNQKYFQRNYMPGMLGWFSMRPNTSIEDIEWMLARSAAFNAGYAFVANFKVFEQNGYTDEILFAIGEWEKARMGDAFSKEQRERMEDISNEFHLEKVSEDSWNLYQVYSFKFNHGQKVRQPGEPLYSTFNFENPTGENTLQFVLSAVDADLSGINLELDNYKKIPISISLKSGQSLKYTGGKTAVIYDQHWNSIRTISLGVDLTIAEGQHSLTIDCKFNNQGKEPKAKLELRISDVAEPISID